MTREPLSPIARHHRLTRIWTDPRHGAARIFCAVNHTAIGLRFIVTALLFFLIGGVLAMLIRTQLATSDNAFLTSEVYAQIFTMHGTVMMFLFAIPVLEGLALYLLPKMMGARDLAYPRLGAFAYWCYLSGGLILIAALFTGLAPNGGWFMYTPLSGAEYTPGINADIWLLGVTFAEVSAICGAVEIVVTILRMRTVGMGLRNMPIFAWYMLVTAGMILIGFPPLILGSILLEIERAFGWPFFEVARGGDPLLWQHLFWMFGHPEVYIIFLPAAGMVSTILPVFARRPLVGYNWVVAAALATGFVSFGLWVHHMFTVGIPYLGQIFFSAASMLVAIPTAVQFFAWIATLWSGRPVFRLPMLYLAGFFAIFILGGLTGVMIALVPFDWQVHDTHFIVAHLHYVLVGGMVFPVMAAVYYWLPHVTGRMPSEIIGKWAFWMIFVGFNVTFFLMHLTGLLGMPRRVYTYGDGLGWDWLNLVSSIGGFLQAIGFGLLVLDVMLHGRMGKRAPRNPWGADTLEWATPTPTPVYNIGAQPRVDSRHPLWDDPGLGPRLARGEPYPGTEPPVRRETLSVDVLTGEPRAAVILPGPSWLPFVGAMLVGIFVLALLLKLYWLAAIMPVPALALFLRWAWSTGATVDPDPIAYGDGLMVLPHYAEPEAAPGRSGVIYTLVADGTLFAALVFGYCFLWSIAPGWPPPAYIDPSPWLPTLAAASVVIAGALAIRAHAAVTQARMGGVALRLWLACGVGVAATLLLAVLPGAALPPPTSHAYAATSTVLAYYVALHTAIGAAMAGFGALRVQRGYVSPLRHLDTLVARTWWWYTGATGIITLGALYLFPMGAR
ncbi:cytochrome c oxidase subunit I [Verticiella sediminum]|uniref:cytochrome-c oxidase n=1 Tax=Verticiella sediminum TaxID=1247510 RepID=A0A556AB71_9BURK|nr:cytochrome c oxidase subunit I [Verticiella sediminum]TSH90123.1 cytochrome c oxidase subunit I [Verticiella sediminum]